MTAGSAQLGRISRVVTAVAEEVFGVVSAVQHDAVRVHDDVLARQQAISGADVSSLGPGIQARLREHTDLIIGLGLIIAPDLLGDEPLMLEWWQQEPGEPALTALQVDLNRVSLGFYDYARAEWFAVPRGSGRRHVVGPYVDVHGTGSYVLTFTAPVTAGTTFMGVAGADVSAARFEARLLEELADAAPAVLLSSDDRVVFSTSSRWLTGSRLPPDRADHELDLVALPALPWRLGIARSRNR